MTAALAIELIIAITLLLWSALSILMHGRSFDFDTTNARYSFHSVFSVYRQIYAVLFVFGGVLSAVAGCSPEHRVLLALSSVYAMFFVLWLTLQYESYQHVRYKENNRGRSPYTGWKYAITLTLGVLSPLLFAVGLIGAVHGQ